MRQSYEGVCNGGSNETPWLAKAAIQEEVRDMTVVQSAVGIEVLQDVILILKLLYETVLFVSKPSDGVWISFSAIRDFLRDQKLACVPQALEGGAKRCSIDMLCSIYSESDDALQMRNISILTYMPWSCVQCRSECCGGSVYAFGQRCSPALDPADQAIRTLFQKYSVDTRS